MILLVRMMNQTAAMTATIVLAWVLATASTVAAFYPSSLHSMGSGGGHVHGLLTPRTCTSATTPTTQTSSLSLSFASITSHSVAQYRNIVVSMMQLHSSPNNDFDSDFPPPSDNDDDGVDWDAEWKKVVANKDQPKQRPGQDFYKSEAEIVVTKTVNRSIETVQKKVAAATNKMDFSSNMTAAKLTSDWRFWIAILAIVSVATAVLSAPPQMPPVDQSYYI